MSKAHKTIAERFGLTGLLLATSALSTVAPAAAQQSASSGIGEIIVTAQKRSENIQDVPMSITAFGTETLEELHITDFNDYALRLPSVSFTTTGPGYGRVYFRGVSSGENSNHSASMPTVGTYLDEQPITTITGNLDIHLYDIERVEALAGPQGTLYGASSEAGTVRIITNKPNLDEFSASYNVELNSIDNGGPGEVVEGHINLPVSSNAAIRLVGWQEHAGGYIDNVPGSITFPSSGITMTNDDRVDDDYNDVDTWGARAALRVELNDNWTITPSVMGQEQQTNGIFAFDPREGDLEVAHYFPEWSEDRWLQSALTVEGRIANLDVTYAISHLARDVDGANDYTDYAYFYDALNGSGTAFVDDLGNMVNPAQYINFYDRYRKDSQELRFASPSENRLRFVGGLFYQRQHHKIHQRYFVAGDIDQAIEVPGNPNTIWLTEQTRTDRDYAIFGEVSYDFTPQLTVTAGWRQFESRNELRGFFGYGAGFSGSTGEARCLDNVPFRDAPCTNIDKEVESDGHTERLNVTYHFTDDIMVYGTYSTGFRPGGVNRYGDLGPYDPDYLTNYELGWKSVLADNHLRLNGAVFFEQWDSFQYSLLGVGGLTQIINAADAEIYGIEADINWLVTDNFTLSASGTTLNAETTSDVCNVDAGTGVSDCANGLEAPSGTSLPVTPEVKANLTGRYEFTWNNWDTFLQASMVYQGEVSNDLRTEGDNERRLIGNSDAFLQADFSAGIGTDAWSLSMFVNNFTDERGEVNRYAECATSTCATDQAPIPGGIYIVPIQPRTFGIRFGQRF